jgi:hypothetical protein
MDKLLLNSLEGMRLSAKADVDNLTQEEYVMVIEVAIELLKEKIKRSVLAQV